MMKIDMIERYNELKDDEQYLDYKQEMINDFNNQKKFGPLTLTHYIVIHCCHFNIQEYENLIRDSIPDRIMIYFAMEMLCIQHDYILDIVHDIVVQIIKSKLVKRNKKHFHQNDYKLLSEDEIVIKEKFGLSDL